MSDSSEKGEGVAAIGPVGSATARLRALAVDFLRVKRERALARRTSRESLRIYLELSTSRPELTAMLRYREMIALQSGVDADTARRFVERAEREFADWPVERVATLRDVVQFLVLERWRAVEPGAQGFHSRLADVVAREIPDGL